jgi:hypothetical protein
VKPDNDNYFTFSFNVNPDLNNGYTEAFRQGNEPWWWYCTETEGPAAGPVPDFTGATFKSLFQSSTQLL